MATETRETRAMPFLRTELQRPLRTHLGHLIHCPELSRSTESSCAAQKIISSQQKGPNTSKSDKVMRRVESRSPEKWPKGLSTLSLDKRRLGENERVSTMPCFSSTHRTKWWKTQAIFQFGFRKDFCKVLVKWGNSGDNGCHHPPFQQFFSLPQPINQDHTLFPPILILLTSVFYRLPSLTSMIHHFKQPYTLNSLTH